MTRDAPVAGRCPVCAEAFADRPVYCTRCDSPHHQDCWEFTGHCAVYACGNLRYSWQEGGQTDVRTLRVPAHRPSHALIERRPTPLAKPHEEITKKDLFIIDLDFPEEKLANGFRAVAWFLFAIFALAQVGEPVSAARLLPVLALGGLVALTHVFRRAVDAYYVVDRAEQKLLVHRWAASGSNQLVPVRSLKDIASVRQFAFHRMEQRGKAGMLPIGTYWLALVPEHGPSIRVSDFHESTLGDLATPNYPIELDIQGNEIAQQLAIPYTGLQRVDEGTGRQALAAPLLSAS